MPVQRSLLLAAALSAVAACSRPPDLQPCNFDGDCAGPFRCDTVRHACLASVDCSDGSACASSEECFGGRCRLLPGRCHSVADCGAPAAECTADARCDSTFPNGGDLLLPIWVDHQVPDALVRPGHPEAPLFGWPIDVGFAAPLLRPDGSVWYAAGPGQTELRRFTPQSYQWDPVQQRARIPARTSAQDPLVAKVSVQLCPTAGPHRTSWVVKSGASGDLLWTCERDGRVDYYDAGGVLRLTLSPDQLLPPLQAWNEDGDMLLSDFGNSFAVLDPAGSVSRASLPVTDGYVVTGRAHRGGFWLLWWSEYRLLLFDVDHQARVTELGAFPRPPDGTVLDAWAQLDSAGDLWAGHVSQDHSTLSLLRSSVREGAYQLFAPAPDGDPSDLTHFPPRFSRLFAAAELITGR